MEADEKYVRRALELAEEAMGLTAPNPMVGAVVVADGGIVGEGYHRGPGHPHAEVEAMRAAGDRAKGGALYLNLEPCSHWGRTPPCTEQIIEAGLSRVVFSTFDPDERARGAGAKALRAAGIEVVSGVSAAEAVELNLPYIHHRLTGKPFVVLKLASTLDGRLTFRHERALSGMKQQRYVHGLRAWTQAIAIGIGTVEEDHPKLDRRYFREGMTPPIRMVFDTMLKFPEDYEWLLNKERAIIYCLTEADPIRRRKLETAGAEVVPLPRSVHGIDLRYWLEDVSSKGIISVLVEGGGEVATSILNERLFERFILSYSPLISGMTGVSWFQDGTGPLWLAKGELRLTRSEPLDDDLVAVYDYRKILDYLSIVTEEEKIVHGAR